MRTIEVNRYLESTRSVEGWVFPVDAYLFGLIDEVQKRNQIRGPLFEIGVHHGKSALLLAHMRRADELLGVCDVFGRQDLNLDHSGEGSRELFLSNMRKFLRATDSNLRILEKRSEELTSEDTSRDCRFFHIDGGHSPGVIYSDLETAERAIGRAGVIAVDDVFNPNWPGVAEGFFKFMTEARSSLVPILIGANKIFLARSASASDYEAAWQTADELGEIAASVPFTFEHKDWLDRRVLTVIRHEWLDLNPFAAACEHLRDKTWRSRLVRLLLGFMNRGHHN